MMLRTDNAVPFPSAAAAGAAAGAAADDAAGVAPRCSRLLLPFFLTLLLLLPLV